MICDGSGGFSRFIRDTAVCHFEHLHYCDLRTPQLPVGQTLMKKLNVNAPTFKCDEQAMVTLYNLELRRSKQLHNDTMSERCLTALSFYFQFIICLYLRVVTSPF